MRILFVCNICDKDQHTYTQGYQAAAMLWQEKLLAGFESTPDVTVDVLAAPLIPSFLKSYKTLFSKQYYWSHNGTSQDICVRFVNIFPIRNLFIQIEFERHLRSWIRSHQNEEICVVTYSPRIPYIATARAASAKGVRSCAIIPDLPEYSGISRMGNPVYRFLKKYDIYTFYKKAKDVDSFVLFSKYMVEKFSYHINYIVIECICDSAPQVFTTMTAENEKHIVYSGGIENSYGVGLLLEAFSQIADGSYRLDICGVGSAEKVVANAAKRDHRITYYGLVSHEKAVELQNKAMILVNPRTPDGVFTRYSFPSKNAEYMMSGKPVLCFKLDGIPDEYDQYLRYFTSDNPTEMATTICSLCELSPNERNEIGHAGYLYINSSKLACSQAAKLLGMIRTIPHGDSTA